ncbi:MAG TPA: hypothetical protein VML96_05135 [Egibacteraceae bacterium]|nr:hypothetical protein [Egibacteraceae bacterium]
MRRSALAALLLAAALAVSACGEPPVPLEFGDREPGRRVLDLAGVADAEALEQPLAALEAAGWDVVALTFEDDEANLGLAHRAGNRLVQEWGAHIAIVAVAAPGDFTSAAEGRQRFFGIASPDAYGVPRSLREQITEEIAPPLAAANDWQAVFHQAASALQGGLEPRG